MKTKTIILLLLILAFIILPTCKNVTVTETGPDEYTITVECLDMTSLQGDNFVNKLKIDDAQVILNGILQDAGKFTFKITFEQNDPISITLDYEGSVYNHVVCVRVAGENETIAQGQHGEPAEILLKLLDQGKDVHLELYKMPLWVNKWWVKETLRTGSAIYDHDVTVYIVNEDYSAQEWNQFKADIVNKAKDVIGQINPCLKGIQMTLDENTTSGDLEINISKKNFNPTHWEQVNGGIISQSQANLLHWMWRSLEEIYQAMGVRDDVGGAIHDEITDGGDDDPLNRFGKALMRINYILKPDTKL